MSFDIFGCSMTGTESEPGLIPRIMRALFDRIEAWDDDRDKFRVEISYLEIYNERGRDLLNSRADKFRIREHPSNGPYVDGLSSYVFD